MFFELRRCRFLTYLTYLFYFFWRKTKRHFLLKFLLIFLCLTYKVYSVKISEIHDALYFLKKLKWRGKFWNTTINQDMRFCTCISKSVLHHWDFTLIIRSMKVVKFSCNRILYPPQKFRIWNGIMVFFVVMDGRQISTVQLLVSLEEIIRIEAMRTI